MDNDLASEHSAGLVQRMAEAVGETTLRDIARATRHHPETVRRYLSTGKVSTEFIVRVSIAFGVRVDWLLTGQGPRTEAAYRIQAISQASVQSLAIVLGEELAADRSKIAKLEAKVEALEAILTSRRSCGQVSRGARASESA